MSARSQLLPALVAVAVAMGPVPAQSFHLRAAIDYPRTADANAITALNERLAAGETTLPANGKSGRLRALLAALGVPESSQMLVFSKTSLQRHRIGPRSPRAIYFGPDVYVGWVPGAAVLEIAAGDPKLGLVFYSLAQDPDSPPLLRRDDSCLSCHASGRTHDEPGLVLRSVFPDADGDPIASAGETDVTTGTPLAERWGGWFVTGTFAGEHRGNGIAVRDEQRRWHVPPRAATDLRAFAAEFAVDDYLAPTSDVGALLAFEQQATVHNLLVRASLQMRWLLACDRELHTGDHDDAAGGGLRPTTARIADGLAREIAAALLLADEPALPTPAAAAEPFAGVFPTLWPADPTGTRLGRFDLRERTFVLPLSPMVHSPAFAALPEPLRERVLERLRITLKRGRIPGGVQLSVEQRGVLHAHLQATLAGY
ncbi:MAG: hypothetical protein JNK15_14145 [Planctomycetes bacterium]|nr:hypothetical protein [Planctomycetota bacterium]